MTKQEIEKMINDSERFKEDDNRKRDQVSAKNELESYTYNIKHTLGDENNSKKLSENERNLLKNKLEEVSTWIESHPNSTKETYMDKQKELVSFCNPILKKLHTNNEGRFDANFYLLLHKFNCFKLCT